MNWLNVIRQQMIKQRKLQEAQYYIATLGWNVGRFTPPFFCVIISSVRHAAMDKEKLKLIVRNLKLLVDSLESEVYSDVDAYKAGPRSEKAYSHEDNDDDGYPD